jgi:hypothetical protein
MTLINKWNSEKWVILTQSDKLSKTASWKKVNWKVHRNNFANLEFSEEIEIVKSIERNRDQRTKLLFHASLDLLPNYESNYPS